MLQKMGNLLLVLSHADTAVKGHLCRKDTLLCQFELMQAVEPGLLLKLLKSLKHLTLDPSTLPALQVHFFVLLSYCIDGPTSKCAVFIRKLVLWAIWC